MEVSGQLHAPIALPPNTTPTKRAPDTHYIADFVGLIAGLNDFE
jgi:hypothetical protein